MALDMSDYQTVLLAGGPGDGLLIRVHPDESRTVMAFHAEVHTDTDPIPPTIGVEPRLVTHGLYRRTSEKALSGYPIFRHADR